MGKQVEENVKPLRWGETEIVLPVRSVALRKAVELANDSSHGSILPSSAAFRHRSTLLAVETPVTDRLGVMVGRKGVGLV